MSKHKILFASSLKPAFDIRTQKLYMSFKDSNNYECFFCGVKYHDLPKHLKNQTLSWKYGRGLFFRLLISLKFFFFLIKSKPDTIVINNIDLQFVTIFYKLLSGCKIIYDVQENLALNILNQKVYHGFKKKLFTFLTNASNKRIAKYCSGFILAEKCYEQELLFINDKPFIILENKTLPPITSRNNNHSKYKLKLLFSGTIGETSGIERALSWYKEIRLITNCQLTIIGHTPELHIHNKLKTLSSQNSDIFYLGSPSPIPHFLINKEISSADFGLICYTINTSNKNKVPTKLFEYLANQLPIICQKHDNWNSIITNNNAGVIYSSQLALEQLQNEFYTNSSTEFAIWDKNELTKWYSKIISHKVK